MLVTPKKKQKISTPKRGLTNTIMSKVIEKAFDEIQDTFMIKI